jgi:hypothetical protein
MHETDALTNAAAAWVTMVLPRLTPEQHETWEAMLEGRGDVAVQVRLRQGTVSLLILDELQGSSAELYSEKAGPKESRR